MGSCSYLGVDILAIDPARDPRGVRLHLLALEVVRALPGLNGFVGIDLVWHAERGPVVIEVNPRVTSAYVGLSAALGRNLAGELLRSHGLLAEQAARPARPEPALLTIGWDIGGAHAKACRVQGGPAGRRRAMGLPAVAGPAAPGRGAGPGSAALAGCRHLSPGRRPRPGGGAACGHHDR